MIGAFRSSYCSIVPTSSCSLSGPLLYRSPVVVLFDRGHPCFRNFNSTILVDVIRVKSYVNSFLDPTCVPVRISINKLDLIPDRIVAGLVAKQSKNYTSLQYRVIHAWGKSGSIIFESAISGSFSVNGVVHLQKNCLYISVASIRPTKKGQMTN